MATLEAEGLALTEIAKRLNVYRVQERLTPAALWDGEVGVTACRPGSAPLARIGAGPWPKTKETARRRPLSMEDCSPGLSYGQLQTD